METDSMELHGRKHQASHAKPPLRRHWRNQLLLPACTSSIRPQACTMPTFRKRSRASCCNRDYLGYHSHPWSQCPSKKQRGRMSSLENFFLFMHYES